MVANLCLCCANRLVAVPKKIPLGHVSSRAMVLFDSLGVCYSIFQLVAVPTRILLGYTFVVAFDSLVGGLFDAWVGGCTYKDTIGIQIFHCVLWWQICSFHGSLNVHKLHLPTRWW